MGDEVVPDFTPEGAAVRLDLGDDMALLGYPTAVWRFRHRCDRGDRGVIICAPALSSDGHAVSVAGPTVMPSILCPDCGTHGFVIDGRWVPA